jgi:hypothetical protein
VYKSPDLLINSSENQGPLRQVWVSVRIPTPRLDHSGAATHLNKFNQLDDLIVVYAHTIDQGP